MNFILFNNHFLVLFSTLEQNKDNKIIIVSIVFDPAVLKIDDVMCQSTNNNLHIFCRVISTESFLKK